MDPRSDPRSREEYAFESRRSPSYIKTGWNRLRVVFFVLVAALAGLFAVYTIYSRAAPSNDGYVAKLEAQYSASQQEVAELKNALAAANLATKLAESNASAELEKGFKLGAASRDAEVKHLRGRIPKPPSTRAPKPRVAEEGG